MLGAPRVNISVLWTVVTRLASDLRWALMQIDTLRGQLRDVREGRATPIADGLDQRPWERPVGGSDSAAPSSETEGYGLW